MTLLIWSLINLWTQIAGTYVQQEMEKWKRKDVEELPLQIHYI